MLLNWPHVKAAIRCLNSGMYFPYCGKNNIDLHVMILFPAVLRVDLLMHIIGPQMALRNVL